MFWIMLLAFVAFMSIAIWIFLSPGDTQAKQVKQEKAKAKKVKAQAQPKVATLLADPVKPVESKEPEKDWKTIALRWEKNNQQMHKDMQSLEQDKRKHEQVVKGLEGSIKDLTDKLELEKSWREKEQATLDKFKHHEKDLKDQIIRTENDLEREHSNRLRIERELQEIRIKSDAVLEEKRQLAVKAASLETTLDAVNRDLKALRQENAKLKEKREDIQWVAKSAFDELASEHKNLKAQLERLKNANG